ncbi:MAG: hypothetical protein ABR589_08875 [Chthoniobacterales bacterium]
MKNIRIAPINSLAVIALFLSSGCESAGTKKETASSITDATATLAQQKDLAEQWAEKLKHQPDVNAAVLATAEEKYREAASRNKGFLEAMRQGIINKENLATSPTYNSLAAKAAASTKDFVDFAKKQSGAPAPQHSVGAVVAVGGAILEAGLTIWKKLREEARAERTAKADDLVQRLTWTRWSKIQ